MKLRTRFLRLSLTLAAAAFAAVVALVWSSVRLSTSTARIQDSLSTITVANEAALQLFHHRRNALLYSLTRDPERLADARLNERMLRADLVQLRERASTPREAAAVDDVERAVAEYLEVERRTRVEELASANVADSFLPAEGSLEDLVDLNGATARRAELQSMSVQRATIAVGLALAILVVAASAAALLALRRHLVLPAERLVRAIRELELAGSHRALGLGLEGEFGAIERAVDQRSSTIEQQRSSQLRFIAAVAHDLKTPLQSIRGYCSLVRPSRPMPEQATVRKAFAVIDRQVERLSRQLGDLLDASRIEAGELELHRTRVDLRDVAGDVGALFAPTAAAHRLVVEVAPGLVVEADPVRLNQVFTNLVSNAIKYSPHGGAVEIRARREAGRAVVEVRDEGIGIASPDLAHIFDPFQRGTEAKRLDIPGVGLGLAVSRRIVEAHGGTIEVTSEVGRGSTFVVRLPLAPEGPRGDVSLDAGSDRSAAPAG